MQFDIHRFGLVTSTMDVARDLAEQGAAEGTVILAEGQTSGRGRAGHAWYSPPGQALYLSVILRPPLPASETSWIILVTALALCDALDELTGHPLPSPPAPLVTLKWFNDILLNKRKVCGILVESSITGQRLDYAVLGVGMNVNTLFDAAPGDVPSRATSLRAELGRDYDRERVLQAVLAHISARYARLLRDPDRRGSIEEYSARLETLGRHIEINVGGRSIAGLAARINRDGSLVVITDQGEVAISCGTLA